MTTLNLFEALLEVLAQGKQSHASHSHQPTGHLARATRGFPGHPLDHGRFSFKFSIKI